MQLNLPIASERDPELDPAREMTLADFDHILQATLSHALASLDETGSVQPTVFLPSMGPTGIARFGIMPVGDLVNQPVGKDFLALIMSRLIEDPNHDFVVFVHEAWFIQAKAVQPAEVETLRAAAKQSLAHHPKRMEALVVHARSKSRQGLCIMAITRDESGSILNVSEGTMSFPHENGSTFEGRFAPAPTLPNGATLH
jgi:hypothetical protein